MRRDLNQAMEITLLMLPTHGHSKAIQIAL